MWEELHVSPWPPSFRQIFANGLVTSGKR